MAACRGRDGPPRAGGRAGYADAQAGMHRALERHRLAVADEAVGRCRGRRGFAAIVGGDLPAPCIPVQQEPAAAEAGGLRLDQVEDQLHGNGRVDRAAAGLQYLDAGVDGEWIGRRHHVAARPLQRLLGLARLPLPGRSVRAATAPARLPAVPVSPSRQRTGGGISEFASGNGLAWLFPTRWLRDFLVNGNPSTLA